MTNIYNLFKFIESKRPEYKVPFIAKLIYEPNSLSKEDLQINGHLELGAFDIKSLPDNMFVSGFLDLKRSKMTSLPNNLHVKNGIGLQQSKIESLGDNLRSDGTIFCDGSKLSSIPNNLYIGGDFHVWNTPLANKYSAEQIRKMIEDKGGQVLGKITT